MNRNGVDILDLDKELLFHAVHYTVLVRRAAILTGAFVAVSVILVGILDHFGRIPDGSEERLGRAAASIAFVIFLLVWTADSVRKKRR